MEARAGVRGSISAVIVALGLMLGASGAQAEIIAPQHHPPTPADGWQAGTCTSDTPTCTVETTNQFFEQAAGHPPVGFTQFIVSHTTEGLLETPNGDIRNLRVDLPVGLSVNPQATAQCPLATFEASASSCPAGSKVGESAITVSILGVPGPPTPPLTLVPVYNLVPSNVEPALFGFNAVGSNVYLKAGVDTNGQYREKSGDYHEYFTIEAPKPPAGMILKNRLVFEGRAGNGTFITTPSTCDNPEVSPFEHKYSTYRALTPTRNRTRAFPRACH